MALVKVTQQVALMSMLVRTGNAYYSCELTSECDETDELAGNETNRLAQVGSNNYK